ncbi:hypothetical protein NO989_19085 [Alteromonas sp. DY56-G5]|uniref:hypothetical protein n=1 Tax=Alteromonas TaxID=226 RepID=UPI000777A8C2|nr:hypothetical protein [Alteromonas macleodii]AMN11260.1 hypothetical protein ACZ81_06475 [Alteromonas macleodii]MDM7962852.1 hypothetical protein [Alteromonas macleodii]MDM8171381.1 hypothetical protein [Alteromonas macleodii]CAI3945090.1 hypothetical protein EZ55_01348 [Alteromonas macleodii]VTP53880.1 hypothetical protein EZ55_01348 [Alteromonas macleodii]|tara:strand:+ start:3817 stop:4632 length:816 start_codon:yes stop_codon:yes gene_type:complete
MKTLKYFTSQTLRNFQQFQELLVSDEPLGMETFKAQSGVVAMTFNHNLELLIAEKEEQFSSFLGVQIDKSKNAQSPKNQILNAIFNQNFTFNGELLHGHILRLIHNIGDLSKHGRLDRKDRLVSDFAQVEECIFIVMHPHAKEPYYSFHKSVMVTDDKNKPSNLEALLNCGIDFVASVLFELEIIDTRVDIRSMCRSFALKREDAENTFTHSKPPCVVPQYGDNQGPPILPMIYDSRLQREIRICQRGEGFNFQLKFPVEVKATPYLTKPR